MEVVDQLMFGVFFPHPARYGIGVVLVAVPSFVGKVAVPQSGVDFGDDWGALECAIKDLSLYATSFMGCLNIKSPSILNI